MISVCFLFFKIPLPIGRSYPSIVIPTGAKHRVQSPLERWPRKISTDRPEVESRPYEFLLQYVYIICKFLLYIYIHGDSTAVTQQQKICLQCRRQRKPGFNPWVRKIPWRRRRQPIPVFSPGEFHGQRSLVG